MKKTTIYTLLLGLLALLSCSKDMSNYNYSDLEHIQIEGMEDVYSVISMQDSLKIFPIAKSNKDGELEYSWGLYPVDIAGRAIALDTIGRNQSLNHFVTEDAQDWNLVYIVKNINTGYTQYKTATLRVNTPFSRGWYVLKDNGTHSDLDLFLTPTNHLVNGRMENIYSSINSNKIDGKAVFMSFSPSYKSNSVDPSIYANTRALLLVTDSDIQSVNINTLQKIRDKGDIFLGGIQQIGGTTAAFSARSTSYVINNGQLHSVFLQSANTGQFGNKIMIDGNNSSYELSKFMIASSFDDPILFDKIGGNFATLSDGGGSIMTLFPNSADNELSTTNNNQQVLFLGIKSNSYLESISGFKTMGYAILQDKTSPVLKSLCFLEKNRNVLTIKRENIDPASKLYDANIHTLLFEDENLMYFANNNQVYSRNLSSGFEQLQFNTPAGEQVSFIKHLKYSESGYSFNYVIIGTKVGANYKIRMFTKNSGNLNASPEQIMEGQGVAASLLYIAPSVNDLTYPWSY